MNQPLNIEFLKKQTLVYLGKLISFADRDKLKASISPDNDWRVLLGVFSAVTIIFLCIGGYFYLSTESAGVKSAIPPGVSVTVEAQKIKNAVLEISKAEMEFEEISAKSGSVTDPSR